MSKLFALSILFVSINAFRMPQMMSLTPKSDASRFREKNLLGPVLLGSVAAVTLSPSFSGAISLPFATSAEQSMVDDISRYQKLVASALDDMVSILIPAYVQLSVYLS